MNRVTYQSPETAAARDAEQLRSRGERMLELATWAYCEQHYDFARLLTQLATEFLRMPGTWKSLCVIRDNN